MRVTSEHKIIILSIIICIVVQAIWVLFFRQCHYNENLKQGDRIPMMDLSEKVAELCVKGHLHYQKDCGQSRCIIPALTDDGKPIKCYNEVGER